MNRLSLFALFVTSFSACYSGNASVGNDAAVVADSDVAADSDVDDPFSHPSTCTTGSFWTRGNHESPNMHPGVACIDCHSREREAPRFSIAGTVYTTGHEPDDCNGYGANDVQIVVTGADDRVVTLRPNGAGNFYSTTTIARPYRVTLVKNGIERAMAGSQDSGDCNACHTENGNEDAPGRVVAP